MAISIASRTVASFFMVLALITRGAHCAYAFNNTGPLSTFKSRPDIFAPFLNITLHNDALITPGYILLEPYQTTQPGPYLYDNAGNLVWSGFQTIGPGPAHDFHVCPYNGTSHLCLFTGQQYDGYSRGVGLILDSSLNIVQSLQSQGGLSPIDQHEFNVLDSNSALVTIYAAQQYDLSADGIADGLGWITNCWFQEVELGTNKLLFEWSALDHVPTSATTIVPNSTDSSGTGLDPTEPWDYFHINSVDKFPDGDYLISARHTSTIYKISAQNGSILWQLGGVASDFTFGPGLNFSYQHDARLLSFNATTTVISVFDNAADGYNKQSARYSSGLIIALCHGANATATLIQRFVSPDLMISSSQGNVQILDNADESSWASSNVYTAWGENAYIAEYTSGSAMVLQGHFATIGAMQYRSRKSNFTITPTDAPAAYIYSLNNSSQTVFYMSWNGATEVKSWRIYTSNTPSESASFTPITTVSKEGFETIYTSPAFHAYSIIEALDASGNGMRNTTRVVQTFVPSAQLVNNNSCDADGCNAGSEYVAGGPMIAGGQNPVGGGATTVDVVGTGASSSGSAAAASTTAKTSAAVAELDWKWWLCMICMVIGIVRI